MYRDIYGVIILFDLSKQDSIKNVPRWMEEAARYKVEKMVVVGNKKDLGSWISEVLGGPKLTKFKAKLEEFSLINKVAVRVRKCKNWGRSGRSF